MTKNDTYDNDDVTAMMTNTTMTTKEDEEDAEDQWRCDYKDHCEDRGDEIDQDDENDDDEYKTTTKHLMMATTTMVISERVFHSWCLQQPFGLNGKADPSVPCAC